MDRWSHQVFQLETVGCLMSLETFSSRDITVKLQHPTVLLQQMNYLVEILWLLALRPWRQRRVGGKIDVFIYVLCTTQGVEKNFIG